MYSTADMGGAARDVPVEPRQLDISANVVVVFELSWPSTIALTRDCS